jgi:hypothetical protein
MGQAEPAYQFNPDRLRWPVKLHLLSGGLPKQRAAVSTAHELASRIQCAALSHASKTLQSKLIIAGLPVLSAAGITLVPWLRLLWVYGWEIHWHLYWHRILFLTFMACLNTLLAIPDW